MAYSTDLPINTMGRRVRTRLYFTSESHLHTMLNVLRFAKDRTTVLSEQGISILNGTSELCYLTQIVVRLFEDSRWELDDPRRFRVELLFSPGATATPLHMHEQDRDSDPSRFDTAPLEMIGREGLTCQELEDFFQAAVMEGASEEDELEKHEILTTTDASLALKSGISIAATSVAGASVGDETKKPAGDIPSEIPIPPDAVNGVQLLAPESKSDLMNDSTKPPEVAPEAKMNGDESTALERRNTDIISNKDISLDSAAEDKTKKDKGKGEAKEKEEDDDSSNIRSLERKYFWGTVAVGSFMLATSLLVLAFSVGNGDRRARRYSTVKR